MNRVLAFSKSVFRGFGQIMLQNNYWTGILFFLGICLDSWSTGIVALVSNVIGVYTARLLKFDKANIEDGLYGFNATLVGVGLVFFFQLNVWVALAIVIGSVLSTILMEIALRKKLPAFTFPFIVVTWLFLFLIRIADLGVPGVPQTLNDIEALNDFCIGGHAFGEVIFQGSILVGLIFIVGVFINSPIAALYGIVASIISAALSNYFDQPTDLVTAGIFSFNAVLCGIACSGNSRIDGLYVLVAVVLSTLIDIWMINYGLTTLTFPFVLAMWIIVSIKKYVPQKKLIVGRA